MSSLPRNPMHSLADFGAELGSTVDGRLKQLVGDGSLASLVAGAAFESWLSFETRLLLEKDRLRFGLAGTTRHEDGENIDRFWIANEWMKVDLAVGDLDSDHDAVIAVEFKLIHNNKDWPTKVNAVWDDIFPSRPTKKRLQLSLGRLALVGVVAKVYRVGLVYPGQVENTGAWERGLFAELCPPEPSMGRRLKRVWSGERFPIQHLTLRRDAEAFFQLHALTGEPLSDGLTGSLD